MASQVWFKEGVGDVKVGLGGHSASGTSDKKGKFVAEVSFADTGSYEITATELIVNTSDSTFVEIVRYEAKVSTDKSIYHIGENVKITGSATAGKSITLKVDDERRPGESVDGFDYTWKTEEKSPGSYKVAIWVLPFSDPFRDPPDASVSILLIRGGLFAKTSTEFVAIGDDFRIEGAAPGRGRVDILTIAPKGGSGSGFDPDDIFNETNRALPAPGLTYATSGVATDGTFTTEKISVGKDVDTGTYLIAVLNPGQDGVWGNSRNDKNLLKVISNDYAILLGAKTSDQILAILKDRTINAAGSDDLLGIATIKVEEGFVTLDELEDVPLGKKIKVTGTTNRKVDTPIIVTVEGLDETTPKLKPKFATVKEDDKTFYNTFSISFETASANIGKYVVTADDGDGHIASTTATILPAEEPSVNVSSTPTPETPGQEQGTNESATATPQMTTPTTTPTPRTETEKEPGFETIVSIAGLLAVTWLLRRRKRRFNDRCN